LSELQVLVKTTKKETLDPILEGIAKSATALHLDSEDEDGDVDPLESRRIEERMRILELKKRKLRGGGGGSGLSLLTTRNVVFVRDDLDDETGEVDIDSWGDGEQERNGETMKAKADASNQPVVGKPANTLKNSLNANGKPQKTKSKTNICLAEDERPKKKARLSSVKSRLHTPGSSSPLLAAKSPTSSDSDSSTAVNGPMDASLAQEGTSSQKPKSETYKQAWSIDEQNLLEQLLEAVPDGEKYRLALVVCLSPFWYGNEPISTADG
jgi:hypothetical protein